MSIATPTPDDEALAYRINAIGNDVDDIPPFTPYGVTKIAGILATIRQRSRQEGWQDGYRAGLEAAAKFYETHRRDLRGVQPRQHELNDSEKMMADAIRALPIPAAPANDNDRGTKATTAA